ncbi:MAG TPA: hypothetical protein VEZ47_07485 [Gemmatirosa sp.]|nr:hypothetical protein [Gemmatirosa sp.]
MRILYLTAPSCDYLADSVLHGMRSLFGADVVDFPRCDVLYRDERDTLAARVHGRGFTLYGLLPDIPVDRYDVVEKLKAGFFDVVVLSSIHRQFGWFLQLRPWLRPDRTIILDGDDDGALYPYRGSYWRAPGHRMLPNAHSRYLYFKREWTPETMRYRWFTLAPAWLAERLPAPRRLRTVSFSLPAEKIVAAPPPKQKEFPRHIVDPEVATATAATTGYAFSEEADYYADLQASRWGITTRRAGWDCIRHYELAANGTVPCFRDLDRKPATCAPHGLVDGANAVGYRDWTHLRTRLDGIDDDRYAELQAGTLDWARRNTTEVRAQQILDTLRQGA